MPLSGYRSPRISTKVSVRVTVPGRVGVMVRVGVRVRLGLGLRVWSYAKKDQGSVLLLGITTTTTNLSSVAQLGFPSRTATKRVRGGIRGGGIPLLGAYSICRRSV